MTREEAMQVVKYLGNGWVDNTEDKRDPEEVKTLHQALKLLRSTKGNSDDKKVIDVT